MFSWAEAAERPGQLDMMVGGALLLSIGFRWLCAKAAPLPATAVLLDLGGMLLLAFGSWYAVELFSFGALIFVAGVLFFRRARGRRRRAPRPPPTPGAATARGPPPLINP